MSSSLSSMKMKMKMNRSMVAVPLFLIMAYITTSTSVVVVVDAWILSSPSPMTHPVSSMKTTTATGYYPHHITYSSSFPSLRLNSAVEDSVDVDDDVQNVSLPDFGKTTVEVDTIKLVKKRRKKKEKEEKTDDSLYDTTDGVTTPAKDNNNNSAVSEKWRRMDLMGTSLIDQTLEELSKDIDFQTTQKRIKKVGLSGISKEERIQRRRALDKLNVKPFNEFIEQEMAKTTTTTSTTTTTATATAAADASAITSSSLPFQLKRKQSKVLQINIGLYCNQACGHCHVESSPLRKTEMMTTATTARCLQLLKNSPSITTLDITGGAPELNDNFRYLVSTARAIRPDLIIIDRCNLTVLQEPGQHDLVDFLKDHDVTIIASLPCYSEDNVDTQRGNGVFERSISALLALNEAGYGKQTEHTTTTGSENENENDNKNKKSLVLDLVYNPLGAFLPPPQEDLQIQYKKQLQDNFGILFNSLYTITNMPIKRFADFLHRRDELNEYMMLLVRNFNSNTLNNLMCLDTINIGWNGKIYDCDFNQQLGYEIGADKIHSNDGDCKTVFDIESLDELLDTKIRNDNHCFGCTAGMGSS